MRISMLQSVAGPGFSYCCGEVVDVPEAVAEDLVSAGYAAPAIKVEDARKKSGEQATLPAASRRRRS